MTSRSTNTIAEIVDRLTDAQRRVVKGFFDPPNTLSSASASVMRKGLIEYAGRDLSFRLTPLGHDVLAELRLREAASLARKGVGV